MLKIEEYKKLILEHNFYQAHEVLEEFWFPRRREKTREVLIIKGFINAAVAFELKKRGRESNALRVWQTYIKFSKLINTNEQALIELKKFIDNFGQEWLFKNINML